jgi:long-chain fatty acid transport protein
MERFFSRIIRGDFMKKWLVSIAFIHVLAGAGFAASVDTFGIGAKATSLGGAVSASSDDVYSVYYNPAGLSQLKKAEVSAAIQMCDPNVKFNNYTVTGGEAADGTELDDIGPAEIKDKSDNLFIPFLGYAQPITKDLAFGVAGLVPFGLDVEWGKNPNENPGAYNWFHSYYVRETVNPTLSYKINDAFSVGVGVALGKSKSGAEKILNYPTAPSDFFGTPTAMDTFSVANRTAIYNQVLGATGSAAAATNAAQAYTALALSHAVNGSKLELELEDSFNYSFNAGALYKPAENFAIGLTYRGRADAKFEGDVTIDGVKVTTASMRYDHPEQVQAGIMVKPVPSVTLEADVVWTNWSINEVQSTYFDEPLMGLVSEETLERNWHNTNQVRLGAEWQVNPVVALRCGYFYDPSPVPDNTFDIMWPDADRKTYSIGAGFDFGNWVIDTSIQFAYAETKRIIGGESDNLNDSYNPMSFVYDGYRVETTADGYLMGYGVSVTYKF